MTLKIVKKQKGSDPKNIIIGLHGLGDTADNFAGFADAIPCDQVLWACLQAPYSAASTAGMGAQWFNMLGEFKANLESGRLLIEKSIDSIVAETGVPRSKIFLTGFSQGALMTLYTGIHSQHRYAGWISISGLILQAHRVSTPLPLSLTETPILVTHGRGDTVIFPCMHFELLDALNSLGFTKVHSKMYPTGHSLCSEEIDDIAKFIEEHR